jgi:catechol-2,3-dioxygenase
MSRVTEIRYVGYGVTDLDAEAAFYTDVWGLEPVARTTCAGSRRRAMTSTMSCACAPVMKTASM